MASISVGVPADDVFDFVSRPDSMPHYLESVIDVRTGEGDKVQIIGKVDGREFHSDGWFETDAHHLMIRWGSLGDQGYVGHMTVTPMNQDSCKVEVHLLFTLGGHSTETNGKVWDALDNALARIKLISETAPHTLAAHQKRYMA